MFGLHFLIRIKSSWAHCLASSLMGLNVVSSNTRIPDGSELYVDDVIIRLGNCFIASSLLIVINTIFF